MFDLEIKEAYYEPIDEESEMIKGLMEELD